MMLIIAFYKELPTHMYSPGYFQTLGIYPHLDIQHIQCEALHVEIIRIYTFTA